ncbi:MAG: DNA gyrase inhibitor YacG [Tepidisphaerales bacterium]
MRCPICKKPSAPPPPPPSPYPFCSERCKLIDLGRWLDGAYRIPVTDPDDAMDVGPDDDRLPRGGR